ncbi:MAG: choice-of-anchor D domain-containing protein [Phycisphaerales bacterium]|nr:choice-of-anchor D domain-containing protein [Phycisphaerales bacterium]
MNASRPRRRAMIDPPSCEGLEPRVLLATFSASQYFPTYIGYDWGYQTTQRVNAGALATGTSVVQSLDGGLFGQTNVTRMREVRTALAPDPSRTLESQWGGTPAGLRLFGRTDSVDDTALRYGAGLPILPLQFEDGRTYSNSKFVSGTAGEATVTGTISSSASVVGLESITVPAGTFDALRVDITLITSATLTSMDGAQPLNINESITLWLIDGAGIGREERTTDTTLDTTTTNITLTRALSGTTILQQLDSIQVSGRGVPISVGDDSPTTLDGTNFGGIDVEAQTKTRIFVVRNVSPNSVTLATPEIAGDVAQIFMLSGEHADDFEVVRLPVSAGIESGAVARFSVRFNPSALGFRHAVVRFSLAGNPNAVFSFAIRGTGVDLGRIDVTRNGTIATITPGAPADSSLGTFFGNIVTVGDRLSQRTYRITNFGNGPLRLIGTPRVVISGVHAADFVVSAQPLAEIGGDGVTLFVVRFNPTALGTRSASVTILSNDPTRPSYSFGISGVGI